MQKYPTTGSVASMSDQSQIEYSPWGMLFYRDHQLTMLADGLAIEVNCGVYSNLRMYYATIFQILMNVQPLFKPQNIPKWFSEIKSYEKMLVAWEEEQKMNNEGEPPVLLASKLLYFHRKLLWTKQMIGFGVPRYTKRYTKDEIKQALTGEE